MNDLLQHIDKIHSTEMGIVRIQRNLDLKSDDVVGWCKEQVKCAETMERRGKNWYVSAENCVITVNAHSYTIITAHKKRAICSIIG